MPKKISRSIALIKYRNFPLQEYDKEIDDDIFYYPKSFSFYWIKLEKVTNRKLTKEFEKLIQHLDIQELIILGQINKPWISKFTRGRKDYKHIIKAIKYFNSIKVRKKFNGAIQISTNEIEDFIPNFYTITVCDSGFFDYYLTNANESLLFHIHYSGEIKILTLNKEIEKKLGYAINKTEFVDSFFKGTDRIKSTTDNIGLAKNWPTD